MKQLIFLFPAVLIGMVACGKSDPQPAQNMPEQARSVFQSNKVQNAMANAQNAGTCSEQLQAVIAASENSATAASAPCLFTQTLLATIDQLLVCEGRQSIAILANYPCDPNGYYDASVYDPNLYMP